MLDFFVCSLRCACSSKLSTHSFRAFEVVQRQEDRKITSSETYYSKGKNTFHKRKMGISRNNSVSAADAHKVDDKYEESEKTKSKCNSLF